MSEQEQKGLINAIAIQDVSKVKYLIQEQHLSPDFMIDGQSPICVASENGNCEILDFLLTAQCNVNQQDFTDHILYRKPIHIAVSKGHLAFVKKLVEFGVDINCQDSDQRTALHWACIHGHMDIVDYLITMGTSVNIVQNDGFTPLLSATCMGHENVCRLLISNGADVNCTDKDCWTPLHTATCYGYLQAVRMFLEAGADANKVNDEEESAFHIAASCGHLDILQLLVTWGISINAKTRHGFTGFHLAVYHNNCNVVKYLIQLGVDINIRSPGNSPFYLALLRSDLEMINRLIEGGYNLNAEENLRMANFNSHFLSDNREFLLWLVTQARNPEPLAKLTTNKIRCLLGNNLCAQVQKLTLPKQLKDNISLKFLS